MKIYNSFGEMFNAQPGKKQDMSVFNWDEKWDANPPETPEEWSEFVDPDGSIGWDIPFISRLVDTLKATKTTEETMASLEDIALAYVNFSTYAELGYFGEEIKQFFEDDEAETGDGGYVEYAEDAGEYVEDGGEYADEYGEYADEYIDVEYDDEDFEDIA